MYSITSSGGNLVIRNTGNPRPNNHFTIATVPATSTELTWVFSEDDSKVTLIVDGIKLQAVFFPQVSISGVACSNKADFISKIGAVSSTSNNISAPDNIYTTSATGNVISFSIPQVYNSLASPGNGDITDSLTGARTGVVQKIYHNKAVAPTFPAGWVRLGSETYNANNNNIIFAEWVSGTRVEYWIVRL